MTRFDHICYSSARNHLDVLAFFDSKTLRDGNLGLGVGMGMVIGGAPLREFVVEQKGDRFRSPKCFIILSVFTLSFGLV